MTKTENPASSLSAIADKPAAQEAGEQPFVNLFQLQWKRTKQSSFIPPDFSKRENVWYAYGFSNRQD